MVTSTTPLTHRILINETETCIVAGELARVLVPGDIVALDGTLGAGKTAFARALINSLPGEIEDVPSPTFTLVQTYHRGTAEIWHFDLYRLENPDDAIELGIEDAFVDAISLIEWPDKLGPYLPARHLRVTLTQGDNSDARTLNIYGNDSWRDRLLDFTKMDKHGG